MIELVFASGNEHKLHEMYNLMPRNIKLKSLNDLNCTNDLPENQQTLEGNALEKAQFLYSNYAVNCFADDTGLEVETLNNEPGVYSARYAGTKDQFNDSKEWATANMRKLLTNLGNSKNRKAHFRTVIALILNGKEYLFEGSVSGEITNVPKGLDGFGYDPIFMPNGYSKTFAELSLAEKNLISHRAIATKKLIDFLKTV